jgi:GTP-binding protein
MAILAIVGRPNVGKSTLFNRLVGHRDAIVDQESGVTRDRHYGWSDWNGTNFSVIDTGGYVDDSGDIFEHAIKQQVRMAIEEADIILFMVDVRQGLTSMDQDLADLLRRSQKKVIPVVNKVDVSLQIAGIHEFHRLGLGTLFGISAVNGSGTGELLDEVVSVIATLSSEKRSRSKKADDNLPRIAVVGRPNSGKSSLINALLGSERAIVTPVPGTTRDSIHSRYHAFGFDFILVDTAGIRKKAKVQEDIEFFSVMRAIRSIEMSDVCLLMIDAERGFEAQDINIFHLIQKNHKGLVILVNKWDLIQKDTHTHRNFEQAIRTRIAPFRDVPVLFTSVIHKQRIFKAIETVMEVFRNRSGRIPTRELNDNLLPLVTQTPPPAIKGKHIKIKYVTQLPTPFPSFVFFCNLPQYVKEPYKRYLENQLRERYQFTGVPMEIYFRKK